MTLLPIQLETQASSMLPLLPTLKYDIILWYSRPGDPYSCSVVMHGNIGPTTILYSNNNTPAIIDLPGMCCGVVRLLLMITPPNTGPVLVTLGHPPPRGTTTDNSVLSDPATLASTPANIILGRARVGRIIKIVEIRGFAFQSGSISFHVSILSKNYIGNHYHIPDLPVLL